MTDPYYRNRRDPTPLSRSGEVAFCALAGVLLVAALAALSGLGLASALFGRGWVWPHGTEQVTHTLGGLLGGHPGQGLPDQLAVRVPGAATVYLTLGVCESMAAAMLAVAISYWLRWMRPGDARRGMATRWEARQVLGAHRLRRLRGLIRPDVYKVAGERLR